MRNLALISITVVTGSVLTTQSVSGCTWDKELRKQCDESYSAPPQIPRAGSVPTLSYEIRELIASFLEEPTPPPKRRVVVKTKPKKAVVSKPPPLPELGTRAKAALSGQRLAALNQRRAVPKPIVPRASSKKWPPPRPSEQELGKIPTDLAGTRWLVSGDKPEIRELEPGGIGSISYGPDGPHKYIFWKLSSDKLCFQLGPKEKWRCRLLIRGAGQIVLSEVVGSQLSVTRFTYYGKLKPQPLPK